MGDPCRVGQTLIERTPGYIGKAAEEAQKLAALASGIQRGEALVPRGSHAAGGDEDEEEEEESNEDGLLGGGNNKKPPGDTSEN